MATENNYYSSGAALEKVLRESRTSSFTNGFYPEILVSNASDMAGLTSVLQKFQSRSCFKTVTLVGSTTVDVRGIIPESNEEMNNFFEAVGQLEMMNEIGLFNLAFPLPLLTRLLQEAPEKLWTLKLENVKFLNGKDSSMEIENFVSAIKVLPKIHLINTLSFLSMPHPSSTDKALASALVKLPLGNFIVGIDVAIDCPHQEDPWAASAENRPRVGAQVAVDDLELATEALTSNARLEHLQFVDWVPGREESSWETQNKLSSFFNALENCKILDVLAINFQLIRPPFQREFLERLASALPKVSIRKLCVYGIGEVLWRCIENDLVVGFSKNDSIEDMEFFDMPTCHQYLSEKIDFYRYLNRSHCGGCLGSRKEILSEAETIPVGKWVDMFSILAKKTDLIGLSAIYYYLHVYYGANQHLHEQQQQQQQQQERQQQQQHCEGTHAELARSSSKEPGSVAQDQEEVALLGASRSCCYIL